jgi:hypothetical protein
MHSIRRIGFLTLAVARGMGNVRPRLEIFLILTFIVAISFITARQPWSLFEGISLAAWLAYLAYWGVHAGLSTPERRKETKERIVQTAKFAFWLTAAGAVFALVIAVSPSVFPESRWAYALKYDTDATRVQIIPKSADCDFLHAPIGFNPHFHFELYLQTFGRSFSSMFMQV